MNKIYGILAIFAFAGLLLPTSAMQVEASSDLDYMLKIAEKAKRYIKHNIAVSYTHLTLPTNREV